MSDIDYGQIDPGVRRLVRYLRGWGLPTSDSGDGVSKPAEWFENGEASRHPHVYAMETKVEDPFSLFDHWLRIAERISFHLLGGAGPKPGQEVTVSYNAADGSMLFAVLGFTDEDVPK